MTAFEGHQGKEPSDALFHPKAKPMKVSTNTSLPPGAKETSGFTKRTSSVTKRGYLKKIGD